MENKIFSKFDTLFLLSYGALGDFCVILFFLSNIVRQNPNLKLVILTTRNTPLLREMAAAYPTVEVAPIQLFSIVRYLLASFYKRTIFIVPPTFFDVPFFVGVLAKLFTFLRGKTVGFTSRARTISFDLVIPFNTKDLFYKNFTALLEVLGFSSREPFEISFVHDMTGVKSLGDGYIVVAPFASTQHKTLPPDRWIALIAFLKKTYPGRTIVLLGAPSDKTVATQYLDQAGVNDGRVLCGSPFAQVAAVIAHTSCFIGIDSGLTHVAGVQHVPSVVVENLRTPMYLLSYNPNAIVLFEKKNCICDGERGKECYWIIDGVHYSRCMVDVSQERIEEAIISVVEKHG